MAFSEKPQIHVEKSCIIFYPYLQNFEANQNKSHRLREHTYLTFRGFFKKFQINIFWRQIIKKIDRGLYIIKNKYLNRLSFCILVKCYVATYVRTYRLKIRYGHKFLTILSNR